MRIYNIRSGLWPLLNLSLPGGIPFNKRKKFISRRKQILTLTGIGTEIAADALNKRIGFFGRQAKRLHKKLVILGSGALGFKAHAFQGTLLAGIHNVGVSGRQQFAFVRAAGAVPDVAADIIVKTPVEKSFKPVESGHPENETAHGKRQIHTSVHYGAGGKSAGIKPHFFAGRFQGFVFVLPFFIGILLLLRENEILYHSSGSPAPKSFGTLAGLLPASDTGVWEPVQIEGEDYYVQCRALSMEGWRMVSLLPFNDIFRLSHELRSEMLIIVAILGVAAYLLAVALSKSTLNRIFLLAQTMRRVEQGDVDVRMALSGNDEISQLMGNFNQMMNRIDGLMEEKVLYGQQIKNLELKALQAQINPHFLYNSLDLINCTAISRNVPEISRMVKALGRFYRISLSGGNDRIPLADEIRHAQLYTDIQNMRFENRVQVDWRLDEAAGECLIVKITLQPLIENAIIHGILEKPSRKGRLRVTTARSKKRVTITIEDDGVGMDEETLRMNFSPAPRKDTDEMPGDAHVKSRDTDDAPGGYGVRNICERLRIAYGKPYGLSCISTPGKGATVTILIPAVTPDDTPAFEGGPKPERTSL